MNNENKMFVLTEEDLYSKPDDSDCWCSNTKSVIGVFSSKELADKYIDDKRRNAKKHKFTFDESIYDIDEYKVDEGGC